MKKITAVFLIISFVLVGMVGCKKNQSTITDVEKPTIVCTVFPIYDWVMEILGDNADRFNVNLLGKNGMDLHSYQPTAQDIAMISDCDLIVYVGGASDKWVEDVMKNNNKNSISTIKLFDILSDDLEREKIVEGMEHEHHEAENKHKIYDEHVWMSLRLAKKTIKIIENEISMIDLENALTYSSNTKNYIDRLSVLDSEYEKTVSESKDKTIIVADRFPFLYLAQDYDIDYYAAFPGCSADSDVSFETVVFLAKMADKFSKDTILVTENSRQSVAETVVFNMKNKKANIAAVNSCQSVVVNGADYEMGYLDIMKQNLEAFKAALR